MFPPTKRQWIPDRMAMLLTLWVLVLSWPSSAHAQPVIIDTRIDFRGDVAIQVQGQADRYYVLLFGESVGAIDIPIDIRLGDARTIDLNARRIPRPDVSFFRVLETALSSPGDADGDGIDDVWELGRTAQLDPLNSDDASTIAPSGRTWFDQYIFEISPLTIISETSPSRSEQGVSVQRETIVRFSRPLGVETLVGTQEFFAEAGGRRILARTELSGDRSKLSLFYLEPLPGNARVRVTLKADGLRDDLGRVVDADGDGIEGGSAQFEFDTQSLAGLPNTTVCGRVFASELAVRRVSESNLSINTPLGGVTITVDGQEETLRTVTDSFGNFRLTNAPAGAFFVHIDGRTVTNLASGVRYPDLSYYPFVGKQWESIPQAETNIGEVYLPLITSGTLQPASSTASTEVVFPDHILSSHPELAGTRLDIPPNNLFSDSGVRGGAVGIAPVPPDRLPGPLPVGLNFPLVITVQTDGASNFDRPVPVCFPNLPDSTTGRALQPGEKSALWSFNHDLGSWEVVGSMTASNDGLTVCSDPGVGILQPGWHGVAPGSNGGGGPPDCSLMEPPAPEGYEIIDNSDVYRVRLFSGEFFESVVDLRIKSVGFDIEWRRQYRSRFGANTEQGNGWDHSYNIRLVEDGDGVRVSQGAARDDLYRPREQDKWVHNGYFRELVLNPDGTYTQTFEDFKKWHFLPLDGSPVAGRLSSMEDRFGNRTELTYNTIGQLERIESRPAFAAAVTKSLSIFFNDSGLVERLEGPDRRLVRYEYFKASDADRGNGNPGDLKKVTRVVLTEGDAAFTSDDQTTEYTYLAGNVAEPLRHNLVSITSGGKIWLENEYSTGPDPLLFDRVIQQRWGKRTDVVGIKYERTIPKADNMGACSQATVTNRNSFVTDYFYDTGNRLVKRVEHEGKNGGAREHLLGHRISSYVTSYAYNDDNQPTWIRYPNDSEVEYHYETGSQPGVDARLRGNLRRVVRTASSEHPNAYRLGPFQQRIEESYEYNARFGRKFFGFPMKFVTKYTDGRGNSILSTYDEKGSLMKRTHRVPSIVEEFTYNSRGQVATHTHPDNGSGFRRRDRFTYHHDGYLESEIIDDGGLALTSSFLYDEVGNVRRRTDPKGNSSDFTIDTADQVVVELSRPVVSGIRYRKDLDYDARGNLKEAAFKNYDETGALAANEEFTTTFEYDELNMLVRRTEEVGESILPGPVLHRRNVVTEFEYDGNRNLILTRSGEAVAGRDTDNVVAHKYYARDLLAETIRAPGNVLESTTAYDYDDNGNLNVVVRGFDHAPSHLTLSEYDGFNRLVRITDAMGNVTEHDYDKNSNRTNVIVLGELEDHPRGDNNRSLSRAISSYDPENRLFRLDVAFFDPATGDAIEDGLATSQTVYSDSSQVIRTVDDRGNVWGTTYDRANRVATTKDPEDNEVIHTYDKNGNLLVRTESEVSQLTGDVQVFITTNRYDNLDRLVETVDGVGNTNLFSFDSRGNATRLRDGNGNVSRFEFDGLNRLVRSDRVLTESGLGGSAEVGEIETLQEWDNNSRLVAQIDDNGHTTRYAYDALNRRVRTTYADGSLHEAEYDWFDNPIRAKDANGTLVTNRFDALDRLVRKDVDPGEGVARTTTFEEFGYDGLSRTVYAADNDSTVRRTHNSLGAVLTERTTAENSWRPKLPDDKPFDATFQLTWDGVGNLSSRVSPSGRVLTNTFDRLSRLIGISEGGVPVVSYSYIGPTRVERRTFGNQTWSDYEYDGVEGISNPAGDQGFKRIVGITNFVHQGGVTNVIESQRFGWDGVGNKTLRTTTVVVARTNDYRYDSASRLIRSIAADSVTTLTNEYRLDGLGNRNAMVTNGIVLAYELSNENPPRDFEVNQYTATPADVRAYDENGSLTHQESPSGSVRTYLYDYRNRLVAFDTSEGLSGRYIYDPFGTRIEKTVRTVPGGGELVFATERLHQFGSRIYEETNPKGETTSSFVWGRGIDEVLTAQTGEGKLFYHSDDLGNVMVLTDTVGDPVERYDYSDYGAAAIYDARGPPRSASAIGNLHFFHGHRLEAETGLYDFRARFMDPTAGRFAQRDPKGYVDGMNLTSFAANNPWTKLDPFGMESTDSDNEVDQVSSEASEANAAEGAEASASENEARPFVTIQQGDTEPSKAEESKHIYAGRTETEVRRETIETLIRYNGDVGKMQKHLAAEAARSQLPWLPSLLGGNTFLTVLHPESTSEDIARSAVLDYAPAILGVVKPLGNAAAKTTKQGGRLTEPNLPPRAIASEDGVELVHYTRSGDHGPPHLHVIGGGTDTRIGQAGMPIKGSGELSTTQRAVIDANRAKIRKAVDQIGRWFKFNNSK